MTAYIEFGLSRFFSKKRSYDANLFSNRHPLFAQYPNPTFTVKSEDCGPSGGVFEVEYTQDGVGRFPELSWPEVTQAREYLIICEDPDSPFGRYDTHGASGTSMPFVLGIYYGISAHRTTVTADDITVKETGVSGDNKAKGGFRYGQNERGTIYEAPKPLIGHGPHRFIYTVIALRRSLTSQYLTNRPNVEEIAAKIDGDIIGWGCWTASYERSLNKNKPQRVSSWPREKTHEDAETEADAATLGRNSIENVENM